FRFMIAGTRCGLPPKCGCCKKPARLTTVKYVPASMPVIQKRPVASVRVEYATGTPFRIGRRVTFACRIGSLVISLTTTPATDDEAGGLLFVAVVARCSPTPTAGTDADSFASPPFSQGVDAGTAETASSFVKFFSRALVSC